MDIINYSSISLTRWWFSFPLLRNVFQWWRGQQRLNLLSAVVTMKHKLNQYGAYNFQHVACFISISSVHIAWEIMSVAKKINSQPWKCHSVLRSPRHNRISEEEHTHHSFLNVFMKNQINFHDGNLSPAVLEWLKQILHVNGILLKQVVYDISAKPAPVVTMPVVELKM